MNTAHLVISVFGIANGITCCIYLLRNKDKHLKANTFLSYLFIVLTALQAYMALLTILGIPNGQWYALFLQNTFLIPPLWYAFVYSCISAQNYSIRIIHFIPFFLEKCCRIYLLFIIYINPTQQALEIFNLTTGFWQLISIGCMIGYFYVCVRLIINAKQQAFHGHAKPYDINWLEKTHYLILGIILIFGALSVVDGMFYGFSLTDLNYWPVTLALSFIIIWLSLKSYKNDFSAENTLLKPIAKVLNKELADQAQLIKLEIIALKLYLDPELDLTILADSLKLPKPLLSKIINEGLELSISDFINEMRVNEFKSRLEEAHKYQHLSLLGLAYDCGFSSKATFNRVFKNITGLTPKSYRDLALAAKKKSQNLF